MGPIALYGTDGGYCYRADFINPQGISLHSCGLAAMAQTLLHCSCCSHHCSSTP